MIVFLRRSSSTCRANRVFFSSSISVIRSWSFFCIFFIWSSWVFLRSLSSFCTFLYSFCVCAELFLTVSSSWRSEAMSSTSEPVKFSRRSSSVWLDSDLFSSLVGEFLAASSCFSMGGDTEDDTSSTCAPKPASSVSWSLALDKLVLFLNEGGRLLNWRVFLMWVNLLRCVSACVCMSSRSSLMSDWLLELFSSKDCFTMWCCDCICCGCDCDCCCCCWCCCCCCWRMSESLDEDVDVEEVVNELGLE